MRKLLLLASLALPVFAISDSFTGCGGNFVDGYDAVHWFDNSSPDGANLFCQSDNAVRWNGGAGKNQAVSWVDDTLGTEQIVTITITSIGSQYAYLGPAARMDASGVKGYRCIAGGSDLRIDKISDNATTEQLGSSYMTPVTNGQTVTLEVTGGAAAAHLVCKVNGSAVITADDPLTTPVFAGGRVGIMGYTDSGISDYTYFDTFSASANSAASGARKRVVVTQ